MSEENSIVSNTISKLATSIRALGAEERVEALLVDLNTLIITRPIIAIDTGISEFLEYITQHESNEMFDGLTFIVGRLALEVNTVDLINHLNSMIETLKRDSLYEGLNFTVSSLTEAFLFFFRLYSYAIVSEGIVTKVGKNA